MIMENVPKIHEKAHIRISAMYGKNVPNDSGSVIVNIGKVNDVVYFCKVEDGWSITKHIKI